MTRMNFALKFFLLYLILIVEFVNVCGMVCMCVCVHMYTCIYIHTHKCKYVYTHKCVYLLVFTKVKPSVQNVKLAKCSYVFAKSSIVLSNWGIQWEPIIFTGKMELKGLSDIFHHGATSSVGSVSLLSEVCKQWIILMNLSKSNGPHLLYITSISDAQKMWFFFPNNLDAYVYYAGKQAYRFASKSEPFSVSSI